MEMAGEKLFENKIKDYLKYSGAWEIKYWGGGQFTKAGIPDLLICHMGMFIAVEIKADEGRPSAVQLVTLREIDKSGGYAILLYPDMFETFKLFIDSITHGDLIKANEYYAIMQRRRLTWNKKLKIRQ